MYFQTRAAKGFAILSILFFLFIIPAGRIAAEETSLVRMEWTLLQVRLDLTNCSASQGTKQWNLRKRAVETSRVFLAPSGMK